MKKIYLLLISFLILFSSYTSFEDKTMELLTKYKWCVPQEELDKQRDPDEPDDIYMLESYYIYDETSCTSYTRWSDEPNELVTLTVPYYIGTEGSEVKVDRKELNGSTYATYHPIYFDNSKVGKNKKGNYLVEKSNQTTEANILMIMELTDKKLVICSVTPNLPVGISVFEAKPKN